MRYTITAWALVIIGNMYLIADKPIIAIVMMLCALPNYVISFYLEK
jgi:hypothetical protein